MRYRYRNDEELKDSGVEWIGKIPKDWSLIKLKYISHLKSGEYISKDEYDDNGKYNIYGSNGVIGKSNKINNVKKNIIIGRVGACGEVNIATEGWISDNALILDVVSKNYNFNYVVYSLNSMNLKELASGTAQPLITGTQVKNLSLVNLDKNVQIKIANFLDEKTSQFNLIISKKEKLIERLEEAKKSLISEVVTGKVKVVKADDGYELIKRSSEEMKDSGVEWLGKIPKEFTTSKVKYVSDVIDPQPDHRAPKIAEGVGFPYIGIRDLNEDGTINIETARKVEEEAIIKQEKAFKINKGDIVFCKVGTLGLPKFIKNHTRIALSATLVLIKSKDNIINEYLRYVLDSDCVDRQIDYVAQGSTRPSLGIQQIRKFDIPYTNIKEQKDIVTYLNYSIKSIENIIKNTKKQIEKLKEAKQSLISEAVTGKIEILD